MPKYIPWFNFLCLCILIILIGCKPSTNVEKTPRIPQCINSQSRCIIDTHYGKFEVLFAVDNDKGKILTETPFGIVVKHLADHLVPQTYLVTKVSAYLEGKEMFMGKVPVFFKQTRQAEFSAEALLGSCAEEKMVWRLWVNVELTNTKDASTDTSTDKKVVKQGFFVDVQSSRF